MHAKTTVAISIVTTQRVTGTSTIGQKELLTLMLRRAVAESILVSLGTVDVEWRVPLVFDSEVEVSVRIRLFPSDVFDLSRDERIDLLQAVIQVLRDALGDVFPEQCLIKFRLEEVRGALFAEVFGPSFRLPEKRFS